MKTAFPQQGPDDDEKDTTEDFNEWLKEEIKGCSTPPTGRDLPAADIE